MDICLRHSLQVSPARLPVEVVERKGLGHPDTLCDGVAEAVSQALCREYRARTGIILHHNVDKVLLVGGASRPAFGGGEVVEPMEFILAGRATRQLGSESIPVDDIAIAACRDYLRTHLGQLDVDRDVRVSSRIRPGSVDLTALFARAAEEPLANDTSAGTGFAPETPLERAVRAVEQALNAPEMKLLHPEIGADIKVMGVRRDRAFELIVGCAFVGRHVRDLVDYADKKAAVEALVREVAGRVCGAPVLVRVNAADDMARGRVFLTVTGTSAEAGDDGEVGRGNRVGGLITPYRPTTMEAAAGKNPVTHVGKLYHLLASRIAAAVSAGLDGGPAVHCLMVSQIGHPVRDPRWIDLCLELPEAPDAAVRARVEGWVHEELGGLAALREDLVAGRTSVFL